MSPPKKSSVEDIRQRFDRDVDRFSDLVGGQATLPDSALMMTLAARAAAALNPEAVNVLDIGCGAGNGSLRMLERIPRLNFTLVDLSSPMLQKAEERLLAAGAGAVVTVQGDVRTVPIAEGQYDIVLAAAVLHHLRSETEWRAVLDKLYLAMKPGGSIWIIDMVLHDQPEIQQVIWEEYGTFLSDQQDEAYRDEVFGYVEQEDTPVSLNRQLRYLREAGITAEIIHKRLCFAAYGGVKAW